MVVWVLVTKEDVFYPVNYKGGTPGFTTKKLAEETAVIYTKHDKEYIESRGGLHAEPVLAKETILKALKIYPKDE